MTVDVATLDGWFKDAYGDYTNLIPEASHIIRDVDFEQREREGRIYRFPVCVQASHGFTYADPTTDGAFAINAAISMQTQSAEVNGAAILLNEAIGYDAITRASTSKQAFGNATQLVVEQMMESHAKRLELACLYGRSGLATIASSANVNSTTTTFTITAGSWALGIWSGMEQAQFDVYNGSSLVNTTGAVTLTRVTPASRQLRVTAASADITAIDSAVSSNPNTLRLFFRGAFSKEQYGLDAIITNTGTLFSIDATTYALWQGNTESLSGQLTMAKVLAGISRAVARGLNEKVTLYVNPATWADLNSELSALSRFTDSGDSRANGAKSLSYMGPVEIEVKNHPFVKAGEAYAIPTARVRRIGSTDITFNLNVRGQEAFFNVLPSNAGVGLRSYSDEAIIIETPARAVKFSGFTNSGGV